MKKILSEREECDMYFDAIFPQQIFNLFSRIEYCRLKVTKLMCAENLVVLETRENFAVFSA